MISKQLDYAMLAFSTFIFSADRPSILWMYFVSPQLRAVMYSGLACTLLYRPPTGLSKQLVYAGCTMYCLTACMNLFMPRFRLFPRRSADGTIIEEPEESDWSWRTYASDQLGWTGSWWLGIGISINPGNGEWFAFVGHNGIDEKTILPTSVLEQMSVSRDGKVAEPVIEEIVSEDSYENL